MGAKYQAYRNLNKPGFFSIRHKGLVVEYAEQMVMHDCDFHVSLSGRERMVQRRRKAVHAWVSGSKYEQLDKKSSALDLSKMEELWYCPYFCKDFMGVKSGKVYKRAKKVIFINNKCYASVEENENSLF